MESGKFRAKSSRIATDKDELNGFVRAVVH